MTASALDDAVGVIQDVTGHANPIASDSDGFVSAGYTVTVGAVHRALAWLQGASQEERHEDSHPANDGGGNHALDGLNGVTAENVPRPGSAGSEASAGGVLLSEDRSSSAGPGHFQPPDHIRQAVRILAVAPVGRLRIYVEPRDAWIGVYAAPHAVFVCPLPFLVIRWDKRPRRHKAVSLAAGESGDLVTP